jgi:predicted ATPase
LSQEGLAELAGLSVDAIAALERGRRRAPRPHTLRQLAAALRLDDAERATLTAAAAQEAGPRRSPPRPLPAAADELVGRGTEVAETVRRLDERVTRLLTLTGPGGVGKTRLTLATAEQVADRFGDEVCWVPLASLADDAAVPSTVAAAIGLHPLDPGRLTQEIIGEIGRRRLLLVLDNCEHVVAEVASLCAALLESCPNLSVLASSRELLRLPGESVYVVPPLPLPDQGGADDQLEASPAVKLFVDRAAARGHEPTDQLEQVARVVRRLEGMPLAIELAAARTSVLTVTELGAELETSFAVLAGGSSTLGARQQSLRGAIEWSHDLLTPPERELFAGLSVFVGGWTLTAAAAVLGGRTAPDPLDRAHALELTSRLVDKSLVRVTRDRGTARYDMLAVIREFAAGQLDATGREDETARRHAAFYLALVEEAEGQLRGADQPDWLDRLDGELDNLRAAMAWCLRTGAVTEAVRLAGGLWLFHYLRGHYAEGSEWLERVLLLAAGSDDPALAPYCAKALLGAGMLAFLQCEYDLATVRLESALARYQELGDDAGTALVQQRLGGVARERGEYAAAEQLLCRSYDLYENLRDRSGMAWAHNHLGFVAWLRGDLELGARRCAQARDSFRVLGDGEGLAWSLISLGVIAQYGGDLVAAETLLQESLALSHRLGYREGVAWSLNQLGIVERRRGRTDRAVHLLDESLAEHRDLGDRWRSASVLEELATVARERGRDEYAAFLLGAADGIREAIGVPVPEVERADHDATRAALTEALDPTAYRTAWATGRAAPLHAVVDGYPPRAGGADPEASRSTSTWGIGGTPRGSGRDRC